ncbi:S24 family peptidase [Devosia sp. 2618]|uniref:XRE family transcriptional regulator n=1 Tax=Devosia sp. 2618 TaxID=3156454 RepID=UPI0033998FEF
MDTIGTRIKFARKLRGLTQEDVAKHFGINRVSVAQWEGRGNSPEPDKIPELARMLSTTSDWLIKGIGKPPADDDIKELSVQPLDDEAPWAPSPDADGEGYERDHFVPAIPGAIPELDAKAGAGEGAVGEVMVIPVGNGTISAHKIVDEWRIPPAYLREAVSNPDKAIVLGVQGDSMVPNYAPGDKVIIDLSEHELRADGVYLISDGYSEPQIKRLQRIMFAVPPRCKIISDNPTYEAQEVDVDALRILGKVAAYVGRR